MQKIRETRISGEFNGWDGETVYELDDGSRWELAQYRYEYRYKYRPKATLWRDHGRTLLEVEGMRRLMPVRRVD